MGQDAAATITGARRTAHPFAMIENQAILFISTMDLDTIMAIAREQHQMLKSDSVRPKGRLFKRARTPGA